MAKTRVERIASIDEEMSKLAEQRKTLLEAHRAQERKARTRRLCQRGGLLEKMLPDTIPLSDEQFQSFLEKIVANDYGRRTLATFTAQNPAAKPAPEGGGGSAAQGSAAAATQGVETAARDNPTHTDKQPQTVQNGGTGTPQNGTTKPTE